MQAVHVPPRFKLLFTSQSKVTSGIFRTFGTAEDLEPLRTLEKKKYLRSKLSKKSRTRPCGVIFHSTFAYFHCRTSTLGCLNKFIVHTTNMRQEANFDIRLEIQKNLASIYDISLKIKRELEAIENLVREKGCLNIAVDNANKVLSSVVRDMDIKIQPTNAEGDEEESENHMIPMTPDYITELLMNMIHNDDQE